MAKMHLMKLTLTVTTIGGKSFLESEKHLNRGPRQP